MPTVAKTVLERQTQSFGIDTIRCIAVPNAPLLWSMMSVLVDVQVSVRT